MKHATTILAALLLPVLAGGLLGCRSTKKACATCPPTAPAPSYVPSQPPSMTYGGPTMPPPPTNWQGGGFQDVAPPTGAFAPAPAPEPFPQAGGAVAGSDVDLRIQEAEAARRDAQAQLDQMRRKVAEMEDVRRTPVVPVRAGGAEPAVSLAGESQARAFADDLRARGRGDVEVNGSTVVVRFTDAFQSGAAALKGDANVTTMLMATAEALMRYPAAQVSVIGHSDGTPIKITKDKWTDNVHLSRERAQTVAQALARNGVPAGRMAVDGRGSVEPLVFPERTASDRARNRRVEVHVRF